MAGDRDWEDGRPREPFPGSDRDNSEESPGSNLLKALSKAGIVPVGLVPLSPEVIPQAKLIREIRELPVPTRQPEKPRPSGPAPEPAPKEIPARAEPGTEAPPPPAPSPPAGGDPVPRKESLAQSPPPVPAPILERPGLPLISTGDEGPILFMAEPNRYSSIREGLRGAKAKLDAQRKEHGRKVFVFTGADNGVGVSTVTFNLALITALDMADSRVLVIDANISRPSLHQAFNCSPDPGLLNFLTQPLNLGQVLVDSGMPNLHLITCGSTTREVYSPFDLARMDYLLEVARRYYDFVLIDTAPALKTSDSRILARKADGVVVAVRYSQTKNQVGQELIRQLTSDGAEIVGSVLNRRVFVIPKFFYRFI